ncbi:MAG: zinc-binding alcohol dehydrogenase family protein [Rhizobiales bacterium]|nr:zinc-binding alcohol dehydrogenase family protein [Hyphomicrobiales bacterium]
MRAVGYFRSGPLSEAKPLEDVEVPEPSCGEFDIVVDVKAISVNPVDYKVRRRSAPAGQGPKIIGYDAAGVVRFVGRKAADMFRPGDEVYYAGAINRQGCNAERQAVDARIVGRKPKSLDWSQAAALPLTTITAWEMLFDRLNVSKPVPGAASAILIIGGAGGVGSIAIQLARQLTALTVIATASRPESDAWCRAMGAHHVIDHAKPLAAQVAALNLGQPAFVFCTSNAEPYMQEIAALIAPQGRLGLIADTADISSLKNKSVSIHWEFMFTRPVEGTPDISEQAQLLNETARLIEAGKLHTTLTRRLGTINAANLIEAHRLLEDGRMVGKLALEGF